MWLGHFKKFINRSGDVVELPGSSPWLVSHGGTEATDRALLSVGAAGWAGWGQTRRGFPAVPHFKAFKAKVPKRSFCIFAEGGQMDAIQKNIGKLLL